MPVYTYTTLDDPLAVGGDTLGTYASGINAAGQIVGYYNDATTTHGFLYSNSTYTALDYPSAIGTVAHGINNMGQIVGQYVDANHAVHGFLYSNGTYTTLDDPLGVRSFAYGINDTDQIVGQYFAGGHGHGFLYDPTSHVFPPTSHSTIPRPPLTFRTLAPVHLASTRHASSSDGTPT